jgi:hypothetical protein
VAGLLLALWRLRNPAYTTVLVGLVGLLLPGVFSEYAPHYHRILGATAPTALLCGLGLDAMVRLGRQRGQRASKRWPVWVAGSAAVVILAAGALATVRDYFVRWAALPDLFYAFDTGLWQIGQQIAQLPPEATVYLTPRGADHPTLAFALATARDDPPQPVSFDGREIFPLTAGINVQPETYIAIDHEDFRTGLLLPEVLPGAEVAATLLAPDGGAYATVFTRPVGESPVRPPHHAVDIALDEAITLAGYDVQPPSLHPGEVLYLQLHWLVNAIPVQDWTVFTHLLRCEADGEAPQGANCVQVGGRDSRPGGGSLPTDRWQAGWRVLDEYQIALPADLPPGPYRLAVGLYRPDGARLPASGPGILLGEVVIE